MFGWGKKDREITALKKEVSHLETDVAMLMQFDRDQRTALRSIADMETPSANATVKRMAKVAREAL